VVLHPGSSGFEETTVGDLGAGTTTRGAETGAFSDVFSRVLLLLLLLLLLLGSGGRGVG